MITHYLHTLNCSPSSWPPGCRIGEWESATGFGPASRWSTKERYGGFPATDPRIALELLAYRATERSTECPKHRLHWLPVLFLPQVHADCERTARRNFGIGAGSFAPSEFDSDGPAPPPQHNRSSPLRLVQCSLVTLARSRSVSFGVYLKNGFVSALKRVADFHLELESFAMVHRLCRAWRNRHYLNDVGVTVPLRLLRDQDSGEAEEKKSKRGHLRRYSIPFDQTHDRRSVEEFGPLACRVLMAPSQTPDWQPLTFAAENRSPPEARRAPAQRRGPARASR